MPPYHPCIFAFERLRCHNCENGWKFNFVVPSFGQTRDLRIIMECIGEIPPGRRPADICRALVHDGSAVAAAMAREADQMNLFEPVNWVATEIPAPQGNRVKQGQGLCPWPPLRAKPLEPIRFEGGGVQGPLGRRAKARCARGRVLGRALAFLHPIALPCSGLPAFGAVPGLMS